MKWYKNKKIFIVGGKGESGQIRAKSSLIVIGISEVATPVNFS